MNALIVEESISKMMVMVMPGHWPSLQTDMKHQYAVGKEPCPYANKTIGIPSSIAKRSTFLCRQIKVSFHVTS